MSDSNRHASRLLAALEAGDSPAPDAVPSTPGVGLTSEYVSSVSLYDVDTALSVEVVSSGWSRLLEELELVVIWVGRRVVDQCRLGGLVLLRSLAHAPILLWRKGFVLSLTLFTVQGCVMPWLGIPIPNFAQTRVALFSPMSS